MPIPLCRLHDALDTSASALGASIHQLPIRGHLELWCLFCPDAAGVGELESLGQKLLIEWTCPEDISASIFANLPLALRFKPLPSQPYPLPSSVSRCSGFLGPGAGCRSSL